MSEIELAISIFNLISTTILGLVAFFVTKKYSKKSQILNEDIIFHQLFRDFNQRYDGLNESLYNIQKDCKTFSDLKANPVLHKHLIDYFNLCAEEYYWHKKGRIAIEVWKSWDAGMNDWYSKVPVIREAWDEETQNEGYKSYYIQHKAEFFK